MSIISQDLLDELNKKKPGPGANATELEKFNQEYDAVLKEIERKKKQAEEENEGDASHIPGDPVYDDDDGDDDDDDGSADFIPD